MDEYSEIESKTSISQSNWSTLVKKTSKEMNEEANEKRVVLTSSSSDLSAKENRKKRAKEGFESFLKDNRKKEGKKILKRKYT